MVAADPIARGPAPGCAPAEMRGKSPLGLFSTIGPAVDDTSGELVVGRPGVIRVASGERATVRIADAGPWRRAVRPSVVDEVVDRLHVLLRVLIQRRVGDVFEDDQLGAGDALGNEAGVLGPDDLVVVADDDGGRHRNLA